MESDGAGARWLTRIAPREIDPAATEVATDPATAVADVRATIDPDQASPAGPLVTPTTAAAASRTGAHLRVGLPERVRPVVVRPAVGRPPIDRTNRTDHAPTVRVTTVRVTTGRATTGHDLMDRAATAQPTTGRAATAQATIDHAATAQPTTDRAATAQATIDHGATEMRASGRATTDLRTTDRTRGVRATIGRARMTTGRARIRTAARVHLRIDRPARPPIVRTRPVRMATGHAGRRSMRAGRTRRDPRMPPSRGTSRPSIATLWSGKGRSSLRVAGRSRRRLPRAGMRSDC